MSVLVLFPLTPSPPLKGVDSASYLLCLLFSQKKKMLSALLPWGRRVWDEGEKHLFAHTVVRAWLMKWHAAVLYSLSYFILNENHV